MPFVVQVCNIGRDHDQMCQPSLFQARANGHEQERHPLQRKSHSPNPNSRATLFTDHSSLVPVRGTAPSICGSEEICVTRLIQTRTEHKQFVHCKSWSGLRTLWENNGSWLRSLEYLLRGDPASGAKVTEASVLLRSGLSTASNIYCFCVLDKKHGPKLGYTTVPPRYSCGISDVYL